MRLASQPNGRSLRRGVTLVEMLVVVALLLLMMTILASIFQVATGAITVSRTVQELDNSLKFLDMTIRQDLQGVTAKMTPPNDPAQKRGYFEYGENAPADAQGEDTDDYLAMTVKAPEGQTFTGRVWVVSNNTSIQPVTINSQFAEVIYFLRNGNLYRRVLLVVPNRRGTFAVPLYLPGTLPKGLFAPTMFNGQKVSWLAVNDISAQPATGVTGLPDDKMPLANDLGDLTNRERRFARQRFCNDYWDTRNSTNGGGTRDGIIDDGNQDGIPDYWPTLTLSQVNQAGSNAAGSLGGLMNEDSASGPGANGTAYGRVPPSLDVYCFPFIFPGMYSTPEATSVAAGIGWLHALDARTTGGVSPSGVPPINHAPVEFGDSLPGPDASSPANSLQTWWSFPTWRETASANWRDPIESISTGGFYLGQPGSPGGTTLPGQQVLGLRPFSQNSAPAKQNANFLPTVGSQPPLGTYASPNIPYGFDGAGNPTSTTFVNTPVALASASTAQLSQVWEDDLIMTGVRSFDVKAYDPAPAIYNLPSSNIYYNAGYYDLGYASTDYLKQSITGLTTGTPVALQDSNGNPQGFGHEGRMPPLTADFRFDPQRPIIKANNGGVQANNVGDDTTGASAPQRIRRVWDSWSTDYTNAPAVDINLRGSPFYPFPLDRPIYPSYPPPYPQALRGIQIQIRVVDPKNERVKILTIRQDFSDKLQ